MVLHQKKKRISGPPYMHLLIPQLQFCCFNTLRFKSEVAERVTKFRQISAVCIPRNRSALLWFATGRVNLQYRRPCCDATGNQRVVVIFPKWADCSVKFKNFSGAKFILN